MYNYCVTVSSFRVSDAHISQEREFSPMLLINQVKAINYDLLLINLLTNLPVLSLISLFRYRTCFVAFECLSHIVYA